MTTHKEGEHSHGENSVGTYVTVFLVLGFLTIIELFVPEVYSGEARQHTKMLLLVFLAVAKAMIVAYFFMHLKWETKWMKWIALTPVYMGIFAILLMLESVYR
jgi:cytochrome c oxidase subunit 4